MEDYTSEFYIPDYKGLSCEVITKMISTRYHASHAVQTELHMACMSGSIERVVQAVRLGADIDALSSGMGVGPLHLACQHGNVDVVCFLLKIGADADALAVDSKISPLHLSCAVGNLDVVQCLVEHGADIYSDYDYTRTPLHVSVYNNHQNIVRYLLSKGAETSSELHMATCQGNLPMVQLLLESGVDPDEDDHCGVTPLHYACSLHLPDIALQLLNHGADPNAKDRDRFSPLIYALRRECPSVDDSAFYWHEVCDTRLIQTLNVLLEHGVILGPDIYTYTTEFVHNIHSRANSSYTHSSLQYPTSNSDSDSDSDSVWNYDLDIATDNGHLSAVQCLLKAGMEFEPHEWFMDDQWLAEDIEYDSESIRMVTQWCKWRFLAGIDLSLTSIANKIYQSCIQFLLNDVDSPAIESSEDQGQLKQSMEVVLKAKADVEWLMVNSGSPRTLQFLCCVQIRKHLLTISKCFNIFPLVNRLPLPHTIKDVIKLNHLPPVLPSIPASS